jgi:hypothetical protein
MGCKQAKKSHWCPLSDYFLGIFLKYSQKILQKIIKNIFKKELYYFVKVCAKTFPKICHFQSFPRPFTSLFTT